MRIPFFLALTLLLAACAPVSNLLSGTPRPPTPGPEPSSTPVPLSVSIIPGADRSYAAVVGRAPFTVTLDTRVSGGSGPGSPDLAVRAIGQPEAVATQPGKPFAFAAGEYVVTATVKDAAGAAADASRRIVALGGPQPLPAWKYGVTAHLEERRAGYYPSMSDVARASGLMSAAGIQSVRLFFNWDKLSPAPGELNFDDYDEMIEVVRASKLNVLGVLAYSSWWGSSAQGSNDWRVRLYSPPRDAHEFAQYVYEVVRRYRNDVHVWQVWDQPNVAQDWQPAPDAGRYVSLLKETYLAIKYADPSAVVVFGGLSGNGVEGDNPSGWESDFVQAAYAAGARGYFDVMAIHPLMLPNSGIATVRGRIAATRAVMNKYGDNAVPIWLTEIGVPTNAPWWPTAPLQSEADQASWLGQVFTKLWDLTPTIFWYSLQDRPNDDSADAHFGLLRADFSAKPAYDRLRALAAGK